MPSHLHEMLLELFRNRPQFAPEVLRDALHVALPAFSDVRVDTANLTDIKPTEYRADLVVLLIREKPVCGIIVEVQLTTNESKRFAWPAYVANLRARFRCPVCLLVVTASGAVARWAAQPVAMGGGNSFAPLVLGPSGVPKITSPARARADPELAVLSAMAHARDADTRTAMQVARAALAAVAGLNEDRSGLYYDLILTSVRSSMKEAIQAMALKYDPSRGPYAQLLRSAGIAEGRAQGHSAGLREGRSQLVIHQLEKRFGALPSLTRKRISAASSAELDGLAERLLTAPSLREALGAKLAGRKRVRRGTAGRRDHAEEQRLVISRSGRASRRAP